MSEEGSNNKGMMKKWLKAPFVKPCKANKLLITDEAHKSIQKWVPGCQPNDMLERKGEDCLWFRDYSDHANLRPPAQHVISK